MAGRETWLDIGLAVLARHGAGAVRIDGLAQRLGLSKGSFYHHFAGISAYRLDLLDHYERQHTTRYIELVEAQKHLTPREKLASLQAAVLGGDDSTDLEIAMRAWAAQDDDVRAMQQRVDAARIEYLQQLWADLTGDEGEALDMGRLIYVVLVGAAHVVPALTPTEIGRLYDLLLRRVDEESSQ